jgi:predicted secreted protein
MTSTTLLTRLLVLSLSATAAVSVAACAADTEEPDPSAVADETDEQEVKARVIGEESNGTTVEVQLGRSFTVALADSQASSGYRWRLESVDKTLGAPKESYAAPPKDGPVGASGTRKFTWKTTSPLNLVGKHKISFELQRPWAETAPPARTFEVTIDIKDPGASVAKCGGLAGFRCTAANTYCEFPAAKTCGKFDQMGTCQTKPQRCTAVYLPVCGCNGTTYSNACRANAAGVSVARSGPCN